MNRFIIEEITVLDLFSGSGSISYEFASRGCRVVHSVENNYKNFAFIQKISGELGFEQVRVSRANVKSYLATCETMYDIIFADPPFDLSWLEEIPDLVFDNELLNHGGLFILEHPRSVDFTGHKSLKERRNYGNVNFSFFEK